MRLLQQNTEVLKKNFPSYTSIRRMPEGTVSMFVTTTKLLLKKMLVLKKTFSSYTSSPITEYHMIGMVREGGTQLFLVGVCHAGFKM